MQKYVKRICAVLFVSVFITMFVGCKEDIQVNNTLESSVKVPKETKRPTEEDMSETTVVSKPTVKPEQFETSELIETPKATGKLEMVEESDNREYLISCACDTLISKMPRMVDSEEIAGFVQGETKFLVWKYSAMGINSTKRLSFAVLNHKGNYETDFFSYDEEIKYPNYIECVGSNVFRIISEDSKVMYHDVENKRIFWVDSTCRIIEGFSEGYALVTLGGRECIDREKSVFGFKVALLNSNGEIKETPLYYYWFLDISKSRDTYKGYIKQYDGGNYYESNVGKYSKGYFFLNNVFYDINLNPILDLGNLVLVNNPYFAGKYCWIEYEEGGAVWGAYMDINGNFAEEARKMYDMN